MEVYWEMLVELGIDIKKEELGIVEKDEYNDLRIIFTDEEQLAYERQMEEWEDRGAQLTPDGYGVDYYQQRALVKKRVHLYSRIYYFRTVLAHLIGCNGNIKDEHFTEIRICIGPKILTSPFRSYNIIYKFLKIKKWRKYYSSIPFIIQKLGGRYWDFGGFNNASRVMQIVEQKFKKFHYLFLNNPKLLGRKRFPKLQYIALRLLEDSGVHPPYHIPFARTIKKRKSLDPLYRLMIERCAFIF